MTSVKKSAGRRTSTSPQRRASQWVLGVGGVLAIAAAFGPVWVVRAGVAIALVAGLLAVRWGWQELRQARADAGRKQVEDLRTHNVQLSTERQRNLEVVDTLRTQSEAGMEKLVGLQVTIGQLRTEISSLQGDKSTMLTDLTERDRRIARLTVTLGDRESELAQLRDEISELEAEEAEIVAIPRYAAGADWDALPSAEDLWASGNHPTVVDLQRLAYPPVAEERRKRA